MFTHRWERVKTKERHEWKTKETRGDGRFKTRETGVHPRETELECVRERDREGERDSPMGVGEGGEKETAYEREGWRGRA